MLRVFETVTASESFLQSAVEFLLLTFLFIFQNLVYVQKTSFMSPQKCFFVFVI